MKKALLVIDVQNEYFTGALPVTRSCGSVSTGPIMPSSPWSGITSTAPSPWG